MDKQTLRERVWSRLEDEEVARFPFPVAGRIPNFAGAEGAADRLAGTPEWQDADRIKSNPDSPQKPVRRTALDAGKIVYMAVPRLREEECFVELDPDRIDDLDRAATIKGAFELGRTVGPELAPLDLIVAGSVAVTEDGARVGKGEGFSDLEYGILTELGAVDAGTPVATTVHELQVVDAEIRVAPHDVPLDLVVTPEQMIRTDPTDPPPAGLRWHELGENRIAEMPVLRHLRDRS